MAQARILSHTHGGQIDHVTDKKVAKTPVPRLEKDRIRKIDTAVIKAINDCERAIGILTDA